jgi:hypothetical protein
MVEHHVHVVLGEQHAQALLAHDLGGQLHQLDTLFGAMPCGRLVHEQDPGLVGERNGKLQALQVAIGQRAGNPVRLVVHADQCQQVMGLVAVEVAHEGHHGAQPLAMGHERHLHVLDHRHRLRTWR